MRLSRTYRAVLVFLFVGFLGAAGPALDGGDPGSAGPHLTVWMEYHAQCLYVEAAEGTPGTGGVLNFVIVNGPAPGTLQVPFTFDAIGYFRMSFPLSLLNNGFDLGVGIQLVTTGPGGAIQQSGLWALTSRNYVVTDPTTPPCPNCPTTTGGTTEWVGWPGVQGGALYPHCEIVIEADQARSGGQPMLALESGPAGSFPIN